MICKLNDRVRYRQKHWSISLTGTVVEVIESSAFPYTVRPDEPLPGFDDKLSVLAASEIVEIL